ncbi:hypothetical protein [Nocardioides conyzicola]|uniref:hypothetical protein n=1 Tax=Nocardioides conyzicola TaxID=1651781 RepID=UPI0031EFE377
MPDHQRILVVSSTAEDAEVFGVRDGLRRGAVVIAAPTAEAARVVRVLAVEPQVELLLAPVTVPDVDRGHRLDELVRRHALRDRFRDVVVVTDPASAALLLQVLAPGQVRSGGAVTVVGLPRGERPVAVRRAIASGLVLGIAASAVEPLVSILVLLGAVTFVGLGLLLVLRWRHVGRELLLAAAIAFGVVLAMVAGSARFPDGW